MQPSIPMAEAQVQSYPRVQHWLPVQILIWFNAELLLICGLVAFYFACVHFKHLSHVFLSFYWVLFGLLVNAVEFRIGVAQRCAGFLCTRYGLALFFIFAGTLGISFGVGKSADVLVPFIGGIVSVAIGVVCIMEESLMKRFTPNVNTTIVDAV